MEGLNPGLHVEGLNSAMHMELNPGMSVEMLNPTSHWKNYILEFI
jgi:hypothetical protein